MNNSTHVDFNETLTCPFSVYILYTTAMAIISLAAFAGNTLVTYVVYRTRSLRTSINYYYVNMAVSDFLSCLTIWPLYVTDEIIANRGSLLEGFLANISCKLGTYFKVVSTAVSILSLVLIAVDRFIASTFPLKATLVTRKTRAGFLIVSWLIPLAHCSPIFRYHSVTEVGDTTGCTYAWNGLEMLIYFISSVVMYNFAPLIAIIIIYSRIMQVLRRKAKPGYAARENVFKQNRSGQQRNVMKIFRSIVVAYFVCLLPYGVFIILNLITNIVFIDKCKFIRGLCYYLLPSFSATVNPIILFTFSTNFRQALQKLCPFLQSKCRSCCYVSMQLEEVSLPELVTYEKAAK